jgi:hypothetical protein
LGKSLTLSFVNRQLPTNEPTTNANANLNSFQELPTVNCFLTAKNGELNQTLMRTCSGNARFDESKSSKPAAKAASKVCEIFHDFAAVNVLNKFWFF